MDNMVIGDFEGPLDLLLHLIKKNKMEIFDIELSIITKEYIDFINKMENMNLDVASEYLVMASELIEIKSRKLLPYTKEDDDNNEEDITNEEELKKRLIEYKKYKENLPLFRKLEERRFNYYTKSPENITNYTNFSLENDGSVSVDDLVSAFKRILERQNYNKPVNTKITKKEFSIKERIVGIRDMFKNKSKFKFEELFDRVDKPYVVVTFLGVLQMAKDKELIIKQNNNFTDIYLERVS